MQASERYVVTVLVLSNEDVDNAGGASCSEHIPVTSVAESVINQQMGWSAEADSKLYKNKKLSKVMRMLRMMGVEVFWQNEYQDDSDQVERECIKDVYGCSCNRSSPKGHVTLDRLLSERSGFYNVVLNVDTQSRGPLSPEKAPNDNVCRGFVFRKSTRQVNEAGSVRMAGMIYIWLCTSSLHIYLL